MYNMTHSYVYLYNDPFICATCNYVAVCCSMRCSVFRESSLLSACALYVVICVALRVIIFVAVRVAVCVARLVRFQHLHFTYQLVALDFSSQV